MLSQSRHMVPTHTDLQTELDMKLQISTCSSIWRPIGAPCGVSMQLQLELEIALQTELQMGLHMELQVYLHMGLHMPPHMEPHMELHIGTPCGAPYSIHHSIWSAIRAPYGARFGLTDRLHACELSFITTKKKLPYINILPGHPTSSFNGLYKEPNMFVTQRVIHAWQLKFLQSAEAVPALDKEVFSGFLAGIYSEPPKPASKNT